MTAEKNDLTISPGIRVFGCIAAALAFALANVAYAQDTKAPEKKPTQEPQKQQQKEAPKAPAGISTAKEPQVTPKPIVTHKDREQLLKEQGPNPKVEFSEANHDFGELWVGGQLKHSFEVKNVGEKPLNILNVKPSCGCTLAGKYDKVIAPGATGQIPVSVDSAKLFGTFKKTIRVTTDDPLNQNATLSVAGLVKHYVTVTPRSANLQQLKPTEEREVKLTLTNNGEEPLELTLPKAQIIKSMTAEIVEKEPGKVFELIVRAKPPYQEGRLSGTINVKTNNPKQADLKIRLAGSALARIDTKPAQIIVSRPRPNEFTQKISVTNFGSSPVHLLGATVDDEKLSLETKEVEPGKKYEVAVKMPAGYKPDVAGKTLTLALDDSEKPKVEIPIRGSAKPPRPAQLLEGKTAPVASFTTHGGHKIDTSAINDKALVLKFYATWCGFCKKSLPNIEQVYQEYKDKGVRFIAVCLDDPNAARKGKAFTQEQSLAKLKDLGVTFDVAFDPTKEVGKLFKVSSFPTMFILDGANKVAKVDMGAVQGSRIADFKKELDRILAAAPGEAPSEPKAALEPATPSLTSSSGTK
jgi:thiol-disulfide isomerase/thioredoxin